MCSSNKFYFILKMQRTSRVISEEQGQVNAFIFVPSAKFEIVSLMQQRAIEHDATIEFVGNGHVSNALLHNESFH